MIQEEIIFCLCLIEVCFNIFLEALEIINLINMKK